MGFAEVGGADGHGFVRYHDVRCRDGDSIGLMGRAADLVFVVCNSWDTGHLYYKQVRLTDRFATYVDDVNVSQDGFETALNGRKLHVGTDVLTIEWQGEVVTSEPIVEHWPR